MQTQCLAAVRAWRGETPRYVQLAVYACSCPARRPRLVCECQLAARLWFNSRTGASFPVADAEGALFTPAGARGGVPLPASWTARTFGTAGTTSC